MTQKRKADNISGVWVEPFSQPVSVQRCTHLDSVFWIAKTPITHPSTTAGQARTTSHITTICRSAKGQRRHQMDDKPRLINQLPSPATNEQPSDNTVPDPPLPNTLPPNDTPGCPSVIEPKKKWSNMTLVCIDIGLITSISKLINQ